MPTVEQIEENLRVLTEHADKFFEGTVTKEDLFGLLSIAMGTFSDMFANMAKRGALTDVDVGMYQWSTSIVKTICRTLELEPKYGTATLEKQLRQNFRAMLKDAPLREVNNTAAAMLPGPSRQQ